MDGHYAADLGELRGSTSKGVTLSTTAVAVPIPKGTKHLFMTPRNFESSAVVARVAVNPFLTVLRTDDNLLTLTDYSEEAQDGSTSTDIDLSDLPTAASGGYLYIGGARPFRGVAVDVDSVNSTTSTLTGEYWNGAAWSALSVTDGTASTGVTLAQDGNITWIVPADWARASLVQAGAAPFSIRPGGRQLFWVRLKVSAALDSSTTLNSLLALAASTSYFELVANQQHEMAIDREAHGAGSVEALTDAGTGALVLGFASGAGQWFPLA